MAESTRKDVGAEEIANAIRHWVRHGRPEYSNRLRELSKTDEPIPYELLDTEGIRSEKPVEGKLEMPPRSGRGSGQEAWAEFAQKVSDLDEAVLEKMSRDEIIELLEQREIIPTLEEEEEGEGEEEQE